MNGTLSWNATTALFTHYASTLTGVDYSKPVTMTSYTMVAVVLGLVFLLHQGALVVKEIGKTIASFFKALWHIICGDLLVLLVHLLYLVYRLSIVGAAVFVLCVGLYSAHEKKLGIPPLFISVYEQAFVLLFPGSQP
jgi:hypothetical protein